MSVLPARAVLRGVLTMRILLLLMLLGTIAACTKRPTWNTNKTFIERSISTLSPIESCIWKQDSQSDRVSIPNPDGPPICGLVEFSPDRTKQLLEQYTWKSVEVDPETLVLPKDSDLARRFANSKTFLTSDDFLKASQKGGSYVLTEVFLSKDEPIAWIMIRGI